MASPVMMFHCSRIAVMGAGNGDSGGLKVLIG